MNNSPRMKLLTLCIGAALAQMASLPALADSGVGVDTVIGNKANPGYAATGPVEADPDAPPIQRTPTGQMYNYPPLKDEAGKGQARGSVDIGFTNDSDKNNYAKRKEYSDTRDGFVVNNFGIAADSDAARYFSVNGGAAGRADQFYDVTVGKYNSWKVKAFYNETVHVFTDTWKELYSHDGKGNLSTGLAMPTMLTSGAYTAGAANYVGATATCTAAAPCWVYGGKVYGNAVALQGINGMLGTMVQGTNTATTTAGVTTTTTTGVIPIGSTGVQSGLSAAIAAKLAATPYSELSLVRKKTGMRGDITLSDSVKGYVGYGLEKRVGNRPFAMNDGNVSTEFAEPIDYATHDFLAGLSYADDLTQANLRTTASLFRNNISTMNVQYAMLGSAAPQGLIQHATFDSAPNNDAFNLKGEVARNLPDFYHGRFTAAASWGTNRQNDDLLAPISAQQMADLSAVPGNGFMTTANLWNSTNSMSRSKAGQRIDSKMADLGLSLKPTDDLAVKASYRFYETDNKGGYIAYNPLTGQFGRGPSTGNGTGASDVVVAPSGTGTSCYTLPGFPAVPGCSAATLANGANIPVFGQARETRQYNYGLSADYDINRTSSLNASVEREDFHRTFRERAKTEENKVKIGYVNRALADTSLRMSYEQDTKRGSNYNFRTFEDLGTGLPGLDPATQLAVLNGTMAAPTGVTYPALNANLFNRYSFFFRKYDQANRDQKILNTRVNYQAAEDLDIGLNLQAKRADYPESIYGLKKDNQNSIGVDMNFQPSFDRTITAFYNFQKGEQTMAMNSGIMTSATSATATSVTAACTLANIATYGYSACSDTTDGTNGARPDGAKWSSRTKDVNNVLGFGLQEDLGFARLGVDYVYARSSTHIGYDFGGQAFLAPTAAVPAGQAVSSTSVASINQQIGAIAGNALPNMTTVQNTITVNLVKPLDKKTTVRAMYRFDGFRVKDWHYDNVITGKMAAYDAGTLLLDAGPMNYHVNTFGVFLNYKL